MSVRQNKKGSEKQSKVQSNGQPVGHSDGRDVQGKARCDEKNKEQSKDEVAHWVTNEHVFPAEWSPPIPTASTLLSMINVTALFLYRLRELRQQKDPKLAELSEDAKEKEALARYLVCLMCLDDLAKSRSPNAREEIDAIKLANPQGEDLPSGPPEEKKDLPLFQPFQPPKSGENVLQLGTEEKGMFPHAVHESTAAQSLGDDNYEAHSDTSEDSRLSVSSQQSADAPECAGCLRNDERLGVIESQLISQAKLEMRMLFARRAEEDGMGEALEEVFFREEGLEVYGKVQDELEALADEVDMLESGLIDEADWKNHDCLGPDRE